MNLTQSIRYAKKLSEEILNKQTPTIHSVRRVSRETINLKTTIPDISVPKYKAISYDIVEVKVEGGMAKARVKGQNHFDINLNSDIELYDSRKEAEKAAREKMLDIYAEIIDKLKEKYKQLEEYNEQ